MERKLQDHMEREEERFEQLAEDVKTIKNNHLFHMEKDIAGLHMKVTEFSGKVDSKFAAFSTDMSWVKWGIVLILSAFTTGAIALIFKLK